MLGGRFLVVDCLTTGQWDNEDVCKLGGTKGATLAVGLTYLTEQFADPAKSWERQSGLHPPSTLQPEQSSKHGQYFIRQEAGWGWGRRRRRSTHLDHAVRVIDGPNHQSFPRHPTIVSKSGGGRRGSGSAFQECICGGNDERVMVVSERDGWIEIECQSRR